MTAWAADKIVLLSSELGRPEEFSFDGLKRKAQSLARAPYVRPDRKDAEILEKIDYDVYQHIRYRKDRTIHLGGSASYPVQLFHLGRQAHDPVRISIVTDGYARDVIYQSDLFDFPKSSPAAELSSDIGFAGIRIMNRDLKSDWLSFLGSSYFRSACPFNQYGLSARGIAVNTASSVPEEFPRFIHFWLEGPTAPEKHLSIYALLDGPSVSGAYKMTVERVDGRDGHSNAEMNVEANLFLRTDVERLGIAPFSSMFWYGEAAIQQPRDWRPEIHDSDGLAMLSGSGERIWRPLRNPPHVTTNTFMDQDPKGFGLLQRDRKFDHYLDDGVFYNKRPSAWVEPIGQWGAGSVNLVEMPTGEETWDNIVAYWCPATFRKAGDSRTFQYKLTWCDDLQIPNSLARTIGTWTGIAGPPGLSFKERDANKVKVVIDFKGACFDGLDRASGVELVVDVSHGIATDTANYPVVGEPHRWRAMFDVEATGADPADLRAYLRFNGRALTETWMYQLNPITA